MITDMRGVRTCFERHGARAGVTRLSGDGQKEIMHVFALRSYKKSIKTRNKASDAPTARYNPQNDRVGFFKTMGFISQNDAYIFWGVFTPLFFALGSESAPGSESYVHSGSAPDSALGFELALLFVLGRRFCLNRVWTGFVQWMFNGCSMLVQWLFNGCHHASCPPFSASSMNADAAAVSVSSPMSFCLLVVENRVYLGGCFSWKAWQFFATAWQKIRMPCAEVRQRGLKRQKTPMRIAAKWHRCRRRWRRESFGTKGFWTSIQRIGREKQGGRDGREKRDGHKHCRNTS